MKRALVTGVSRGIGAAVAQMLLSEGWEVAGASRTDPPFESSERFLWEPIDLRQRQDTERLRMLPSLDALIHCAAIRPSGAFEAQDIESWAETITTNLIGTARVVKAALPALLRSDDPRILLFSGGGAFDPSPGFSAYGASKAGVVALMETLAVELDGRAAVNCVAPGYVPTSMHAEPVPDDGRAMQRAVACVRHLLAPATRGLSGRTVSAAHDDWEHLSPLTVDRVMDSHAGQRTRHKISRLEHVVRYPTAALECPVGATA